MWFFFTYKALIYFKTSQLQVYIYLLLCEVIDYQLICYSLIHVKSYLQIAILSRLYLFEIVPLHSDDFHNIIMFRGFFESTWAVFVIYETILK